MIVTVPEYKKIYYNDIINESKALNENLYNFDSTDYMDDDDDPYEEVSRDAMKEYEITDLIPKVERILFQLNVPVYNLKPTGNGIVVDVPDHLFLPNKKLYTYDWSMFAFGEVLGDVNFSNNRLTNWSCFPSIIRGKCIANQNYITDFNGVPDIKGKIEASRQKIKTKYPLTTENYIKYKNHELTENSVYSIKYNEFGELVGINENEGTCLVQFSTAKKECFLNEVEYLGNIDNLMINGN